MFNVFQSKRALRIYGISVLGVALVCVVLRLVGMLFFFDKEIGYYESGSVIPTLFTVLLIAAVVVSFALCFIPKLRVEPKNSQNTRAVSSSAFFPAAGFASYALTYAISLFDYINMTGTVPFLYVFTLLCAILACVFYCIIALSKKTDTVLYLACGILAIVLMILTLAECYFDTFVQMNSPTKIIFQFAMLSAMLLTVNELRAGIGASRPSFHLFAATVAAIFLPTSAIPSLICYYTDNMSVNYVLSQADFTLFMLAVFAIVRLVQLCFGKDTPVEVTEDAQEVADTEAETADAINNETEEITLDTPEETTDEKDNEGEGV